VPFLLADAASAVVLYLLARQCHTSFQSVPQTSTGMAAPILRPRTLTALLLWNPFLILTAAASSSASLVVTATLLAALGGVSGSWALAAAGCAMAMYLRPHSLLFTIPVSMMLFSGAEDLSAAPTKVALGAAHTVADAAVKPPVPEKCLQVCAQGEGAPRCRPRRPAAVAAFWAAMLVWLGVLLVLSDVEVQRLSAKGDRRWISAAWHCITRGWGAVDDPSSVRSKNF
jgi:hypothetical protein